MPQQLVQISLIVKDYDEAIAFYTEKLGFVLLEDTPVHSEKRWVRIKPAGDESGCSIVLAKATNEAQMSAVGNQTGGRVFLFLHTDDFDRDYTRYIEHGIEFITEPRIESYGKVAVFKDLYGNLWDMIEPMV